MRFELFVALRYLKAKRRQSVISVVTIISIIGVTAGVCALVVALAINNGFREELEKSLLGATANVNLLRSKNDGIRDYEALTVRLSRLPHVVACAPALYGEVLASFRSRASGIVLKGIDPQREVHVGDLLLKLREGSLEGLSQTFADADPIILGKELAKSLGAYVGNTILITSPQGYLTPQGLFPKYRHFRVVGVFDSGFYDFDATWTFTNLPAAQRLLDLADVASVIEFKIDNIYEPCSRHYFAGVQRRGERRKSVWRRQLGYGRSRASFGRRPGCHHLPKRCGTGIQHPHRFHGPDPVDFH